jgi:endo-1,4-beta-xylanase
VNRLTRRCLAYLIVLVALPANGAEISLRDAFDGRFLIGAALNYQQILGNDQASPDFIARQFSALTAESAMKWERIQPVEGEYVWDYADKLAEFANSNDIHLTGHTLVWHQQTPDWVFEDSDGRPATRELLLARLESHIRAVVGRYQGRVHSWDVVNEALNEDGTLRATRWRTIIGDDYLLKAYQFAHSADPQAKLYYNDFNLYKPLKRAGAIKLIRSLRDQGAIIHGIGMQAHYSLDSPSNLKEAEDSIVAFSDAGLDVLITELDVSVLPFPNNQDGADLAKGRFSYDSQFDPYSEGLPDKISREFSDRYVDLFRIFLAHSDNISRVTLWGIHDAQSWKNNWPMMGRTDYPLLFDRNNQPKAVIDEIIAQKDQTLH